jgi:hypothetical protein
MGITRPARSFAHRPGAVAAVLAALLLAAGPAFAQSASHPATLRREILRAFQVEAWAEAVDLIELYLEKSPNDAGMLYNGACALCRLDRLDEAATYLYRAMRAGYRDLEKMRDDPDLAALRDHPTFERIFETLRDKDEFRSRDAVGRWRDAHKDPAYRYETDQRRRIQYATALDETAHREMRGMLEAEADHLIGTLFDDPPGYYVLVAVPTPEDADEFFRGDLSIGGMYQHTQRTLVARNIGGSLRHEFFHAMHYGHMEKLHQLHRLWIQEGLAALYEDYELHEDGSVTFPPNDRHNIVRARARAGRLMDWRRLFDLNSEEFMGRANVLYPQVRSIFRYVAEQGRLVTWYRAYTRTYASDPSGVAAFEEVFGKPLEDVERDWRRWLASQPAVDMVIARGDASLGIRSGQTNRSNDGVLVTDVLPDSAAEVSGLSVGDVIVAADGRDTRTIRELQLVIGARRVGEFIELRVRRDGRYFTLTVQLRPLVAGY